MLLFLLLQRLTGALWRSAFVAALFALHPLHVESVAWVAERKDVLSTFFFMLTLGPMSRYAEVQKSKVNAKVGGRSQEAECRMQHRAVQASSITQHAALFYLLALLLFALGLMSKPMLVTLPFVLLLLDFWPLRRLRSASVWGLVGEKIPFLGLSLASSVVTFLMQQQAEAVSSLESLPLEFRLSNALISYVRYASKMVWPAKLAVFYPLPAEWPAVGVAGAALVLAGRVGAGGLLGAERLRMSPSGGFGIWGCWCRS